MARRLTLFLVIAALLATAACTKQPAEGEVSATLVPVQIAVRVENGISIATKGNSTVITEMDQAFRGIEDVIIIPFKASGGVSASDRSLYHPAYLPNITDDFHTQAVTNEVYITGLVANNNAHLYSKDESQLPKGTASVLVYGHTPQAAAGSEVETKHLYGALAPSGLAQQATLRYASDITFDPVAIYPEGFPSEAVSIANTLNYIAGGVTYTSEYWYQANTVWKRDYITLSWNESIADTRLAELFQWFTNNGNLTTGAGHNAEYMISRLYRILKQSYLSYDSTVYEHITSNNIYDAMKEAGGTIPLTYADLYNGIRDAIISRIETLRDNGILAIASDNTVTFADNGLGTYPTAYGLPDGAAVVQWTGVEYRAVSQVLDGVAPISQYCYPPDLWYYVNTTLSTSTQDKEEIYTSDNQSWRNDILPTYRSGKVLQSDTKSAALDSALRYSSGMLIATIRAEADRLDDADGLSSTQVTLGASSIPVTGVIIGSQRRLGYDFTPIGDTDYFLYDNCISGVYLTRATQANAHRFKTLVSQTPDGDPVYFCLELRNDSGSAFTGADGLVLPGSKFYLVGSIELPQDDSYTRAFERYHTTTVHCLVTSLADARTAIPDLEHPHLSVGLQVNINWKESTPTTHILY